MSAHSVRETFISARTGVPCSLKSLYVVLKEVITHFTVDVFFTLRSPPQLKMTLTGSCSSESTSVSSSMGRVLSRTSSPASYVSKKSVISSFIAAPPFHL